MSIDTVNDLVPRVQYVAMAAQTTFPYPFPIFQDADLDVYVDGVLKALNTDYVVSGEGDDLGGNVTFTAPLVGGEVVTIIRDIAIERDTDVSQNGPWSSTAYNDELDKVFLLLQQLKADFKRSLRISSIAEVDDDEIEIDVATFANMYLAFDADGKPVPAVLSSTTMTQAILGLLFYPRSAAEITAGVVPVNYFEAYGYVERQGAVGDDVTSDTAAINRALSVNEPVHFKGKTYACSNLLQTHSFQRIYGTGDTRLRKNANGAHFTSSGSTVELNGIGFRGDASSPVFTGNGIVSSGGHFRLINCGSRWCPGRAVLATGDHTQIIGTCDLYQTTDATGSGYDIELGVSGTATLYHAVTNIYTSQATGGILLTDVGGHSIVGSQFGKLTIAAGTLPGGVNGGTQVSNRINGAVAVGISNSSFAGNSFSGASITFAGGTSGHSFDETNLLQVGTLLTDSSSNSTVVDARLVPHQTYAPAWTASTSNPVINDGTIVGRYSKRGRAVDVSVRVTMGAGTTYGTGNYFFSLPAIPSTVSPQFGAAQILDSGTNFRSAIVRTLTDGTARCQVYVDSGTNAITGTAPITLATGDQILFTLRYYTD